MFNDDLMKVDFSEFDSVVVTQIDAKKAPDMDDDFGEDALDVDMNGYGEPMPIGGDSYEPVTGVEVPVPEEDEEEEPEEKTEECNSLEETEDLEESKIVVTGTGTSILEMYNQRNRKRNKIVESLLVDNTVDSITQSFNLTMKSFGISKAETTIVLGLILDRMLHASDDDIVSPDFLDSTLGDLIKNKDAEKIIKKAVTDALSGVDNPGLETIWVDSNKTVNKETGEADNDAKGEKE